MHAQRPVADDVHEGSAAASVVDRLWSIVGIEVVLDLLHERLVGEARELVAAAVGDVGGAGVRWNSDGDLALRDLPHRAPEEGRSASTDSALEDLRRARRRPPWPTSCAAASARSCRGRPGSSAPPGRAGRCARRACAGSGRRRPRTSGGRPRGRRCWPASRPLPPPEHRPMTMKRCTPRRALIRSIAACMSHRVLRPEVLGAAGRPAVAEAREVEADAAHASRGQLARQLHVDAARSDAVVRAHVEHEAGHRGARALGRAT